MTGLRRRFFSRPQATVATLPARSMSVHLTFRGQWSQTNIEIFANCACICEVLFMARVSKSSVFWQIWNGFCCFECLFRRVKKVALPVNWKREVKRCRRMTFYEHLGSFFCFSFYIWNVVLFALFCSLIYFTYLCEVRDPFCCVVLM